MVAISTALQAALFSPQTFVYTADLTRYIQVTDGFANSFVYTDLAFGSQSFTVLVDSGSSDTWLASSDFACIQRNKDVPQAACQIGPLYNLDEDFVINPGRMFRQRYSPLISIGYAGTVPVTIAGLTTTAAAGVANVLEDWDAASIASGFVGLGFSPMTGEWTPDSTVANHTHIPSKSLLTSLFEQHQIPGQFALSISRPPGQEVSSYAGVLTIGGLPHLGDPRVNATNDFARASFETYDSSDFNETNNGLPLLADYTISVESLYYGTLGNMSVNSTPAQYFLDSGITAITIPTADLNNWVAMFNPPLRGGEKNEVSCSAPVPELKFKIGGKLFPINPTDIVKKGPNGRCFHGLQGSEKAPYVLGDFFHRNVVAVYDWDNLEMRFASRPYYRV